MRIEIDEIETMAHEVIDMAVDLKLVKRPASFRKKFIVKEKRTGAYGGVRGGVPFIGIGATERNRDSSQYEKLMERTGSGTRRIWNMARENWSNDGAMTYIEYASIADDPEIGWFKTDHINDMCFAMVMHEVAHAVDWWNNPSHKGHTAHGSDWRFLYRQLRRNFGFKRGCDGFLISQPIEALLLAR